MTSCLLLASPTADRRAAAEEIGISEGFLSRSIQRELGVTFVEHRARTRVAHFLALVHSGHTNLLSAALEAGFGSYSQFHRIFTRLSGSRPRDYADRGRRRLQLLVAGDLEQPDLGPVVTLSESHRQHAPL
jgi:methylphosphotriester-DNA--protein-cysteine methyltransferase